jgi:hypothetical protein
MSLSAYLTPMSRSAEAREANERVARKAERCTFRARVPMLCECGDPDCREIFLIELEEFRRATASGASAPVLTAPGHRAAGARVDVEQPGYWLQLRR